MNHAWSINPVICLCSQRGNISQENTGILSLIPHFVVLNFRACTPEMLQQQQKSMCCEQSGLFLQQNHWLLYSKVARLLLSYLWLKPNIKVQPDRVIIKYRVITKTCSYAFVSSMLFVIQWLIFTSSWIFLRVECDKQGSVPWRDKAFSLKRDVVFPRYISSTTGSPGSPMWSGLGWSVMHINANESWQRRHSCSRADNIASLCCERCFS